MRGNELTFWALRKQNVARCNDVFHPLSSWSPTDWGCASAGEVGELCNLLKKLRRGEDIPITDIAFEAADAVIYLDLLCARLGINLGEAIVRKFNLVSEQKGSSICL